MRVGARLGGSSWTVLAGTAALATSSAVLPSDQTPVAAAVYEGVVYVAIGAMGLAVTLRRPGNAVGWLLQLIALVLALNALANDLYLRGYAEGGDPSTLATLGAWCVSWLWVFAIVPAFTLFPLVFPTGRLPSPRWRPLLQVSLVAALVTWFSAAFAPGPLAGADGVDNPYPLDHPAVRVLGIVGFVVLVPATLASITSLFLRFRSAQGAERQQLKWVATASALLPVGFTGLGVRDDEVGFMVLLTSLLLVVVAVAVAMLRHRLYDIDVVIKRTLVYGSLVVLLVTAYAVSVLLLQLALRPLTRSSDLAVAGSTLAVAALFQPARDRIRDLVDRRFYRSRYDAARTLSAFTDHLRDQLDADAVAGAVCEVVAETMQPAHVSLWVPRAGARRPAAGSRAEGSPG